MIHAHFIAKNEHQGAWQNKKFPSSRWWEPCWSQFIPFSEPTLMSRSTVCMLSFPQEEIYALQIVGHQVDKHPWKVSYRTWNLTNFQFVSQSIHSGERKIITFFYSSKKVRIFMFVSQRSDALIANLPRQRMLVFFAKDVKHVDVQ